MSRPPSWTYDPLPGLCSINTFSAQENSASHSLSIKPPVLCPTVRTAGRAIPHRADFSGRRRPGRGHALSCMVLPKGPPCLEEKEEEHPSLPVGAGDVHAHSTPATLSKTPPSSSSIHSNLFIPPVWVRNSVMPLFFDSLTGKAAAHTSLRSVVSVTL